MTTIRVKMVNLGRSEVLGRGEDRRFLRAVYSRGVLGRISGDGKVGTVRRRLPLFS